MSKEETPHVFCLYCTSYGLDCNPDPEDWSEPCEYFVSLVTEQQYKAKRRAITAKMPEL